MQDRALQEETAIERAADMAGWNGAQRTRVQTMTETLSKVAGAGEGPTELMHDARNMVTALALYCELLEEPGVLSAPFAHLGTELRLVAAASRRLVEKLSELDLLPLGETEAGGVPLGIGDRASHLRSPRLIAAEPIERLAGELATLKNLLGALAGPAIELSVETPGGALPVELTREDLTRVLVNLVKNSTEAMPEGGRISIRLDEFHSGAGEASWVVLTVEDDGLGIPAEATASVFEPGFTTRPRSAAATGAGGRRGLGLAITRSIVEAAGGRIRAVTRPRQEEQLETRTNTGPGARFDIELPVRK